MTTTDDIQRLVSAAIQRPMTVPDAIRFIEIVMADLEGMLDGLQDDLKREEQEE